MQPEVELQRGYAFLDKVRGIKALDKTAYFDGRVKNIPPGVAYEIGTGIAATLQKLGQDSFLLSGDGRASTPMILEELTNALIEAKIRSIYAGYENTTPMFEFAREHLGISGLNVTASHQAPEYNGFKLVIEAKPKKQTKEPIIPDREEAQAELRRIYLESVAKTAESFTIDSDIRVLYDAMQGISYPFFAETASRLGISFGGARQYPDPYFHLTAGGPDPSKQENYDILKTIMLAELADYDAVLVVDGDGDRFGAGTAEGLIPPPVLIALRAEYLGKWSNGGTFVAEHCVATIISDYLSKLGVQTKRVNRGRAKIIPIIKETEGAIGGAEYGLHNYLATGIDDALVNSLEFIAILTSLRKEGMSLQEKIEQVAAGIRFFVPEFRGKYTMPREQLVEGVRKKAEGNFGKVQDYDGLVFETEDLFWNFRPSSNEDSFVINANGTKENEVHNAGSQLRAFVKEVDPEAEV